MQTAVQTNTKGSTIRRQLGCFWPHHSTLCSTAWLCWLLRRRKRLDTAQPAVAMPAPTARKSIATTERMVSSERPKPWPNLRGGQGKEKGGGGDGRQRVGCGRLGRQAGRGCNASLTAAGLVNHCAHAAACKWRSPTAGSIRALTQGSRRRLWRPPARSRRPQRRGRPAPSGSWSACDMMCGGTPSWAT